jgi:hypothetical protein
VTNPVDNTIVNHDFIADFEKIHKDDPTRLGEQGLTRIKADYGYNLGKGKLDYDKTGQIKTNSEMWGGGTMQAGQQLGENVISDVLHTDVYGVSRFRGSQVTEGGLMDLKGLPDTSGKRDPMLTNADVEKYANIGQNFQAKFESGDHQGANAELNNFVADLRDRKLFDPQKFNTSVAQHFDSQGFSVDDRIKNGYEYGYGKTDVDAYNKKNGTNIQAPAWMNT